MNNRVLQNFHAFSKLYGYVRFFHPSDEAAAIDWDKFSVYGFQKAEQAADNTQLKNILLELFLPIAPSIEIYLSGEDISYDLKKIIPLDTNGLLPVAWQHKGIQTIKGKIYDIYESIRVNRIPGIKNHFGELSSKINVNSYRDKKIRISAGIKLNIEDENSSGELWIRTFSQNGTETGFSKTEFAVDKWEKYTVETDVTGNTAVMEFGAKLIKEGILFVSGFTLEVFEDGEWKPKELNDGKFESQVPGKAPENWNITGSEYIYEIIEFDTFDNDKTCFIQSKYSKQPFEKYPQPGELINKQISGGLNCIVPLALYCDNSGTLPHGDEQLINTLHAELAGRKYDELNADNKYVRLSGIALFWNVIQHSYPYFEIYDIDWESELDELINNAYNAKDALEFHDQLRKGTAILNDGHADVIYELSNFKYSYPPVRMAYAEGRFVISRLLEKDTGLLEGDIVIQIDGLDIQSEAEKTSSHFSSATAGWKMKKLLGGSLLRGEKDSIIDLKILRMGKELSVKTKRTYLMKDFYDKGLYSEYRPEKIAEIKPLMYYIDLTRLTTEELDQKMNELAEAKGVIFDLRGYPKLSPEFLCHLTDKTLRSARWNVPQIIYPDRENLAGYDTSGRWEMEPVLPGLKGRIVFMTDGGAISYAESVMGIVEAYKLGTIVGEPTFGTNGNVNLIKLPGGYTISFTGMKVLKHDGSRHHGVGILPDIIVNRTIKGISAGRDEYLEKALEILENNN